MQYKLMTLTPKHKDLGIGTLSVDQKNKDAQFFSGNAQEGSQILAEMHRVNIDWAARDGIQLSGFQPNGCEKNGTPKYIFQKWFLRYLD